MENKNWIKIGLIGYLLALPVMIWKSSRIGKAISLLLLILVAMFFLNFIAEWGTKTYSKFLVMNKVKPLLQKIEILNKNTEVIKSDITNLETKINRLVISRLAELENKYKSLVYDKEEQFLNVEKSLELLKETERQAVKDKIIEIKEQVKLYNQSIDSKEIRKELEIVASNLYLLTINEKDRFMKDLEDIGFNVQATKKNTDSIIYTIENEDMLMSGWSSMSASNCVVVPTRRR